VAERQGAGESRCLHLIRWTHTTEILGDSTTHRHRWGNL